MTTLQDAPDPCGCHTSFAEHQLVTQESAIQDMILPSTTERIGHQNGMEFGMVHISSGGPEMSPFVPILLFLAFAAAFIRHCSGATQCRSKKEENRTAQHCRTWILIDVHHKRNSI
jgi:hypothetical protein